MVERFAPTWLLISAGFDAHRDDPLTELGLTAGDYSLLTAAGPAARPAAAGAWRCSRAATTSTPSRRARRPCWRRSPARSSRAAIRSGAEQWAGPGRGAHGRRPTRPRVCVADAADCRDAVPDREPSATALARSLGVAMRDPRPLRARPRRAAPLAAALRRRRPPAVPRRRRGPRPAARRPSVARYDLDLTTDARPPEIKALLAGWADAVWTQGERFGTIGARRDRPDGSTRDRSRSRRSGRGATTTTRASRT